LVHHRYSRFTGRAYGVNRLDHGPPAAGSHRYLAREAEYDPAARSWTFRNGSEVEFDVETGEIVRPTKFAVRTFPGFHENPQLMLLIDRNPIDLSFASCRQLIDFLVSDGSPKVTKYALRYYSLIADTLSCLIVIGIAIRSRFSACA